MKFWLGPIAIFGAALLSGGPAFGQNPLSDFSRAIRNLTQRVSPAVVQIKVNSYGPMEEGDDQQVALMTV